VRKQAADWTKRWGTSDRLYPGSLLWCFRKPGRDLRDKVENWLAWKRVSDELAKGVLGGDFDKSDRAEVHTRVADAEEDARDEVWAGYRFVVLADHREADGLKVIDLGAGHASSSEALCGRVIAALKSEGLLNESVGAGYIERNWPPALKDSGAWPLTSLRQSFLNGALTRLPDPDATLRKKIVEFVGKGEFGLASGQSPGGGYERVWFQEQVGPDEVAFEPNVFLLTKSKSQALKAKPLLTPELAGTDQLTPAPGPLPSGPDPGVPSTTGSELSPEPPPTAQKTTLRIVGQIPSEVWNRLGTKLLTKLKTGEDLRIDVGFRVTVKSELATSFEAELRQVLDDLALSGEVQIQRD
jgi:hypothetical protein